MASTISLMIVVTILQVIVSFRGSEALSPLFRNRSFYLIPAGSSLHVPEQKTSFFPNTIHRDFRTFSSGGNALRIGRGRRNIANRSANEPTFSFSQLQLYLICSWCNFPTPLLFGDSNVSDMNTRWSLVILSRYRRCDQNAEGRRGVFENAKMRLLRSIGV